MKRYNEKEFKELKKTANWGYRIGTWIGITFSVLLAIMMTLGVLWLIKLCFHGVFG